ncbi:MAG: LysR substrate-binding domain-containing protein [Nannocystaceae bacterium]
MSRLDEMETFLAVARAGSFAAAATRLERSASSASKLVSRLEQRLNARLLDRTTRSVTLTAVGERFYDECSQALELLSDAENAVLAKHHTVSGRLRATVPTGLGHEWLTCVLAEFVQHYPQIQLEVVYLDRRVDLVAEGFDVAVRVGAMPDSSMIVRRIASTRVSLVASPRFLERHGPIAQPEQLTELPCLLYAQEDRGPGVWTLERDGETRRVAVRGPMVANSGRALVDAAACGLGLALVPELHSVRKLVAGELVRVLPAWGSDKPVQVVHPSARLVPLKVRAFVDHLVQQLRRPGWLELEATDDAAVDR